MLVLFIMCRQFNILTLILNCFDWCPLTILGPHKRVQVWCRFLFICIVCYYWYNLKSTTLSRFFFTISVQASNVANVLLFCSSIAIYTRFVYHSYMYFVFVSVFQIILNKICTFGVCKSLTILDNTS